MHNLYIYMHIYYKIYLIQGFIYMYIIIVF